MRPMPALAIFALFSLLVVLLWSSSARASVREGPPDPSALTLQPARDPGLVTGYALLGSGFGLCLAGIAVTLAVPWGVGAIVGFSVLGAAIGILDAGMIVLAVTRVLLQRGARSPGFS